MVVNELAQLEQSSAILECRELVDLAGILDPEVNIAIWQRAVDDRIVDLLARDDCLVDKHSRFVGHRSDLQPERDLADMVPEAARDADPEGAKALVSDITELCEMFGELMCADELMVSLESPENATCPRFHVDRVGIRMLVTYLGPGTQCLPNECVHRNWLGGAGHGKVDEETGLILPGAKVRQVSPFDVVLLKGEAWPGAAGFGAVHRSPDPGDELRVLLRVDMLSQSPVAMQPE